MSSSFVALDSSDGFITEVDVRMGIPSLTIIGMPDRQVREIRETVRCALLNRGYDFPLKRITVNILPMRARRSGPSSETAYLVALALLAATGQRALPDGPIGPVELDLQGTTL